MGCLCSHIRNKNFLWQTDACNNSNNNNSLFAFPITNGFAHKNKKQRKNKKKYKLKVAKVVNLQFLYSMLPSFRTGPVFVQKELYLIIFVGHLNLRQPKNYKNKRNISAINCRFCRAFWRRSRSVRTISFEVSKSLAANICTFHCTVKVLYMNK